MATCLGCKVLCFLRPSPGVMKEKMICSKIFTLFNLVLLCFYPYYSILISFFFVIQGVSQETHNHIGTTLKMIPFLFYLAEKKANQLWYLFFSVFQIPRRLLQLQVRLMFECSLSYFFCSNRKKSQNPEHSCRQKLNFHFDFFYEH